MAATRASDPAVEEVLEDIFLPSRHLLMSDQQAKGCQSYLQGWEGRSCHLLPPPPTSLSVGSSIQSSSAHWGYWDLFIIFFPGVETWPGNACFKENVSGNGFSYGNERKAGRQLSGRFGCLPDSGRLSFLC